MQQLILETRTRLANYKTKVIVMPGICRRPTIISKGAAFIRGTRFNRDARLQQQVENLQKSLVKSNEEKQFLATELELLKSQSLEKEKELRCEYEEKFQLSSNEFRGIPLRNVDCQTEEDCENKQTNQEIKQPDAEKIDNDDILKELTEWKLKYERANRIVNELTGSLEEKSKNLIEAENVIVTNKKNQEDFAKEMVLKEENLRRDMEAEKSNLQSQLEETSQQICDYKEKITEMEQQMEVIKEKEDSLQGVISKAQNKESSLLNQMRDLQQKHNEIQMIVADQNKQLQSNEDEIKKLDSLKIDLNQQLESEQLDHRLLQARYAALQMERDNHLQQLRCTLEEAARERREIQEKCNKELEHLRSCNTERDQQLMDDYEWKLREIERDYKAKMDKEKKKQSDTLTKTKEDLEKAFEQERKQIINDKETVQKQVEELQGNLKSQSHLAEIELKQLRGVTEELQKGMKSATAQVDDMQLAEDRMRDELSKAEENYEKAKRQISKLQYDICDLKELHSKRLKNVRDQSKKLVENAKSDEESYWKEHFREEKTKLMIVLEEQYEDERQVALETLQEKKNAEIKQLRDEFEQREEELNFQLRTQRELQNDLVLRLKELTDAKATDEEKYLELKRKSDEKILKLQKELKEAKQEYDESVAEIEEEKRDYEKALLAQRTIEMQRQETSHKSTVDRIKEDLIKHKDDELEKQSLEFQEQLDHQRLKMDKEKKQIIEEIVKINKQKLKVVLQDFEKTKLLLAQKERYVEELEKELQSRELQIQQFQSTVENLEEKSKQLSLDLQFQSNKISKIGNETTENPRYWLSQMVFIPAFVLFSSTALAFSLALVFLFFILSFIIPYLPL